MGRIGKNIRQGLKRITGISTPFIGVTWTRQKAPEKEQGLISVPPPDVVRQLDEERRQADLQKEQQERFHALLRNLSPFRYEICQRRHALIWWVAAVLVGLAAWLVLRWLS
jgi:hypothetical protein